MPRNPSASGLCFQVLRANSGGRAAFKDKDVVNLLAPAIPVPQACTSRQHRRRRSLAIGLNCLALLCVAVFLRCYHLANLPGVNGDEAWSGVQALRWLHGESISWWTPTGNPLNWFYFVPIVALHAVAPPSFALLRLPALISGLLALPINYGLCRRTFDTRTAVISTWLLALMPIDIAYSRFGWDASQSMLATLLVMYLALIHFRRRQVTSMIPTAAVLALVVAIWVHPTNVFAAPLLVVPAVYRRRQELARAHLQPAAATAKTSSRTVLPAAMEHRRSRTWIVCWACAAP